MDTMDMCSTCHLLSLVILSVHLYNHAIVYLGSINTQSVLCMLVLLLYSIAHCIAGNFSMTNISNAKFKTGFNFVMRAAYEN